MSVSSLECLASLHQFTFSLYHQTGVIRKRHGNRWENLYITMLPCRDGWVAVSASSPEYWERLCLLMDKPELLTDERFSTGPARVANSIALDEIISKWLHTQDKHDYFRRSQEEWRCPWGALQTFDEVLDDPHCVSRGFWVLQPDGLRTPGFPAVMAVTPWSVQPAPAVGEHNSLLKAPAI